VAKDQENGDAIGFPARSFTAVVIAAVYVALPASTEDGVKVVTVPARLTAPVTGAPLPSFRVKEAVETVERSTGSLKVAVTVVLTGTLVVLAAGVVPVTVGGVMSGAAPVVNVQEYREAKVFPARSLIPVVRAAVKVVP
jgi:hypothetical protein